MEVSRNKCLCIFHYFFILFTKEVIMDDNQAQNTQWNETNNTVSIMLCKINFLFCMKGFSNLYVQYR